MPFPYGTALAAPASPIRVVLADDHRPYRYALAAVLVGDARLDVVGEAPDGKGALDLVREFRPDVAVVDVVMAPIDGFDVCAGLSGSETEVILLSAHEDPTLVARARAAGAAGYLSKNVSNEALCSAVVAVAAGGTCFDAA
jgi:DNA-binding NarL/FixJ family response regulator